ncbi:hypothetical protein [Paenibacillus medicaginis]|uniref:Uncharacterized protein n=1 Tax=Paenibacillus medicaginis TaxID=1470560 RepID=A0ABV5BZZ3_9BACL
MDEILRRIETLERDQAELKSDLKEKPSKSDLQNSTLELKLFIQENINKLPNEDRMKTLINEQLNSNKIASETFVESKVNKAKLTIIIWAVGIGVTVAGVLIRYLA